LARGIFTSVSDLARKLRRFIAKYNERARPVRWAYADPADVSHNSRNDRYGPLEIISLDVFGVLMSIRVDSTGKGVVDLDERPFVLWPVE
jgi:hypothetical protein